MDVVQIEYQFADALGIQRGKRGDVNDADAIRSAQSKYLVKAAKKALKSLRLRMNTMTPSDERQRIEFAIANLELVFETLNLEKVDNTPGCLALWSTTAISLTLIKDSLSKNGV